MAEIESVPPAKKKRVLQKFKTEYTQAWPLLQSSSMKGSALRNRRFNIAWWP